MTFSSNLRNCFCNIPLEIPSVQDPAVHTQQDVVAVGAFGCPGRDWLIRVLVIVVVVLILVVEEACLLLERGLRV